MIQLYDEPDFLKFICWTDESKFTNNGIINKQNNRYWANHNPYWTTDTNCIVWGTNVWCGLLLGDFSARIFTMVHLLGEDTWSF